MTLASTVTFCLLYARLHQIRFHNLPVFVYSFEQKSAFIWIGGYARELGARREEVRACTAYINEWVSEAIIFVYAGVMCRTCIVYQGITGAGVSVPTPRLRNSILRELCENYCRRYTQIMLLLVAEPYYLFAVINKKRVLAWAHHLGVCWEILEWCLRGERERRWAMSLLLNSQQLRIWAPCRRRSLPESA
jgi:hypothetical protein